jgi:opacity protein-like surface antigen
MDWRLVDYCNNPPSPPACAPPFGPGHLIVHTTANGTIDDTRVGWTVGGGVETEVSQNWKARVEYRYTDLGHFAFDIPLVRTQTINGFLNVATSNAHVDLSATFQTLRLGLVYNF